MATYNFKLNQGSDLRLPLVLKDASEALIDLTGYSCAMQVRTTKTNQTAIDTLTVKSGRITITPTEGKIDLIFPHSKTSKYPAGNVVYDIELTSPDGYVTRILEGTIKVSGEVTRVE
jgi:hypothetical protein